MCEKKRGGGREAVRGRETETGDYMALVYTFPFFFYFQQDVL